MNDVYQWFSFAGQDAALFIISMIPVVELRGAVILGAAMDMAWHKVFIISVLGNLLPIPFVLLFIKKVLYMLKRFPAFAGFIRWYEGRLVSRSEKFGAVSFWALALFVSIPLPGTGAWTGAGVAAFLNMRLRTAFPAIVLGVLIAGVVMTAGAYGVANILKAFP
ncbi:MAG: small multi-drug export protein [Clostridiales bacterium]|nr:small multi-drug export protein [Clostridiales bacterium]